MEYKNAFWFSSGMGTVGIVQAMDERKATHYFIGIAQGLHEPIDINNIMNIGASFTNELGALLFKNAPTRAIKVPKNSVDTL